MAEQLLTVLTQSRKMLQALRSVKSGTGTLLEIGAGLLLEEWEQFTERGFSQRAKLTIDGFLEFVLQHHKEVMGLNHFWIRHNATVAFTKLHGLLSVAQTVQVALGGLKHHFPESSLRTVPITMTTTEIAGFFAKPLTPKSFIHILVIIDEHLIDTIRDGKKHIDHHWHASPYALHYAVLDAIVEIEAAINTVLTIGTKLQQSAEESID